MAEFVRVMGEARRMCEASKYCAGCKLRVIGGCAIKLDHPLDFDLIGIEKVIMEWAADHPQKTMEDVLFEKHPAVVNMMTQGARVCPRHYNPAWGGLCDDGKGNKCRECWRRPVEE